MKTASKILCIMFFVALFSLAQVSCTSTAQYDIRGTWSILLTYYDLTSEVFSFTFTGTRDFGTATHTGLPYPGTYSVDGDRVEFGFQWDYLESSEHYEGQFDSEDTMSGTFEWDSTVIGTGGPPFIWAWGTFTATRM